MIKEYFRLNVWACFLLVAILNLQSAGVSSGTKQSWVPGIVGYSLKSLEASRYGKQASIFSKDFEASQTLHKLSAKFKMAAKRKTTPP